MKKVFWACLAAATLSAAAPAQELPKLTEFLSSCTRDNTTCMQKIKNYIEAAKNQKMICLPADVSVRSASSGTLSWLRKDANVPQSLADQPFDEGLYEATSKLYPCKSEEEPPAPPVPPPAESAPQQ
jgi:hypothetical protein